MGILFANIKVLFLHSKFSREISAEIIETRKRHIALRLIPLILFVWFSINANFSYHTHVVNGVVIAHSHLGAEGHEHADGMYKLIDLMSQIVVTAAVVTAAILFLLFFLRNVTSLVIFHNVRIEGERLYSLRAPPVA